MMTKNKDDRNKVFIGCYLDRETYTAFEYLLNSFGVKVSKSAVISWAIKYAAKQSEKKENGVEPLTND